MPVKVLMPQMGESITEGTIVRWFKAEGDAVKKDEPLLEISTDKVDAEVPSPASGTLSKILHGPGETVAVETVIGEIAGESDATGQAEPKPVTAAAKDQQLTPPRQPAEAVAEQMPLKDEVKTAVQQEVETQATRQPSPMDVERRPPSASSTPTAAKPPAEEPTIPQGDGEEDEPETGDEEKDAVRRRSSPLVRRIAAEHEVDLAEVQGTGIHGRVTKADVLAFIEGRTRRSEQPVPVEAGPAPETPPAISRPAPPPRPTVASPTTAIPGPTPSQPFSGDELREPASIMRTRIAEHMVASKQTSAHVYSVFEVDVSRALAMRERNRAAFERANGLKLTVTPFFLAAVVEGLKAFPVVNASLDGKDIVYHRHINLGVAVALPGGLIVPVITRAEELSIIGLQRAVTDLATRARNKQLKPEEVHGSTFSVTNPGQFGGILGLPIINQPNVAIMSIGNVQRRPVVVTDDEGRESIAIRDVVYLALSFDHRLIDGAVADQFMAHVKSVLEDGRVELA